MLFIYRGCPGEGRGGQKLTVTSSRPSFLLMGLSQPNISPTVTLLSADLGGPCRNRLRSISICTAMYKCPPMGLMMTFTFILTAQCSLYSFLSAFLPLQPFRNWNFILKAHKRGALYILPITVVRPECRWSGLHGRILPRPDFLYLRQPMKVKDSPISHASLTHFRSGCDRKV